MNAGRPNIVDAIKNGEIQLVINTPIGKRGTTDDSYIRKTAIKYKVSVYDHDGRGQGRSQGNRRLQAKEPEVVSLQKYHAGIK